MSDRNAKRVFIINNISSDAIDQAIFILKDSADTENEFHIDRNVADEAQQIIDNYIRQVTRLKKYGTAPKQKKTSRIFPTLATVGITALFMSAVFFTIVYNM